jgi:hypothetical protein
MKEALIFAFALGVVSLGIALFGTAGSVHNREATSSRSAEAYPAQRPDSKFNQRRDRTWRAFFAEMEAERETQR